MIRPLPHPRAAWALLWLCATPAALAQTAAQLPAITVTADKQERALESLPGSLSVFDGDMLESQGVLDLDGLQRITPGLTFQSFGQAGVNAAVMRGLSANFFSFSTSTLLVVDGVPTLMAQGFVTTGRSGALLISLPTNTKEVVPEDSPASPKRLIPVAYMAAMASLQPATTGIPAIKPVSFAASSVTKPIISSTSRGLGR